MLKKLCTAAILAASISNTAWADTFDLGLLNPSASQTASYSGGILDNFKFSIGTGNWVQIDFLGSPSTGTGFNSVEYILRDSSFNNLALWSGFGSDPSYAKSYTYTGLSVGEEYTVNVYGWANPMSDGTGTYKMTLTAQTVAPIPEPEIYAMMGVGLSLLGWVGRRRKLQVA